MDEGGHLFAERCIFLFFPSRVAEGEGTEMTGWKGIGWGEVHVSCLLP